MTALLGPAWDAAGEPLLVQSLAGPGYPRARHRQRTQLVVDDHGNAVAHRRRCADCARWLPLDFGHFWPGEHGGLEMGYRCHSCSRLSNRVCFKRDPDDYRAKARRRYRAQVEGDPEWHAKKVARDVERTRARRKQDPERYREYDRGYRERLRAAPERYAERLETDRIERRLRRIDAGLPVRDGDATEGERMGRLSAAPLVAAVDEWLDGRPEIAAEAFVDPRNLSAWRTGEYASTPFDVADRILIGIDLLWWEVWKPDKPGHERAAELFTGEKVAA